MKILLLIFKLRNDLNDSNFINIFLFFFNENFLEIEITISQI